MMTISAMQFIVSCIRYKPGWSIIFDDREERPYIQLAVGVESDATLDSHKRDGKRTPWKSGKRYLSPHMCRQEIVGVVFGLIKDAEMHEIHEWFRYKGASIYNPHLDPDVLVEVARKASSYNVRENAMTMDEPKKVRIKLQKPFGAWVQFAELEADEIIDHGGYTDSAKQYRVGGVYIPSDYVSEIEPGIKAEVSASSERAVLEQLEWSSRRQGAPTGMGLNNGEWIPSCPHCGGLKYNDGSFKSSAVGHRPNCALAAMLKKETVK